MPGIYIANVRHMTDGARTLISFDQGGKWNRLTPPKTDLDGNVISCKDVSEPCCLLLAVFGEASVACVLVIVAVAYF